MACATRGEAGELRPGYELGGRTLAEARVEELHAAAATLGAAEVVLLDFADSGMAGDAAATTLFGAPFAVVVAGVGAVVERVDPDVVVTLDESGGDGHRDHVRIAEATIEAVRERATAGTLYSWCVVRSLLTRWLDHQRATSPDRAYLELDPADLGRPDEHVTTVVEAADLVAVRQRAIALHRSQVSPYEDLPADLADAFLRSDAFVRHEPPWAGGPLERALRVRAQDGDPSPGRA